MWHIFLTVQGMGTLEAGHRANTGRCLFSHAAAAAKLLQ